MIDVLAMQQAMPVAYFGPGSRYAGIATARFESPAGTIVYIGRRFLPQPESLAVVGRHTVLQGQRLDHLAARYFGDPELFWRIADANRAMRPEALTGSAGRRLVIALPEGIPGTPDA